MKNFALALTAAAMVLPSAAIAQSLHETHEIMWMPSGKAPSMIYRMRDRSACTAAPRHQAGKGQMLAASTCSAKADKNKQQVAAVGSPAK